MKKSTLILLALLLPLPAGALSYETNDTIHFTASELSHDYTNFTWHWSGYSDFLITNVSWTFPVSNALLRLARTKTGASALDVTNGTVTTGGTNFWVIVPQTNFPNPAAYYAEFIGWGTGSYTSVAVRSLAKGVIIVHRSLFGCDYPFPEDAWEPVVSLDFWYINVVPDSWIRHKL